MQTRQPEAIRVRIFVSVLLSREGSITEAAGGVEFTGSQGSKNAEMVSAHGPARSWTNHQV
jgi:PPE-repeat protein